MLSGGQRETSVVEYLPGIFEDLDLILSADREDFKALRIFLKVFGGHKRSFKNILCIL